MINFLQYVFLFNFVAIAILLIYQTRTIHIKFICQFVFNTIVPYVENR